MRTVTLFRHAKSDWKDSAEIRDFDRPLAERGIKAAPRMGQAMRDRNIRPDLILCSPSVRTRQTLELATRAWDAQPATQFDPRIYDAEAETLVTLLRASPDTAGHVMVVGHNPGLHDLARTLIRDDDPHAGDLAGKLPTAAVVTIALPIEQWTGLVLGQGTVQYLLTPKTVQAAS
jgi:phosphohistidine phosphatase